MAMLLTYLKTTAENAVSTKVADCVISVCVNVQQICQIFMKYCQLNSTVLKVEFRSQLVEYAYKV